MIEIPIPRPEGAPLPWFDMQVVLDSVTYTLELRWNKRAAAWFLTLWDETAATRLYASMKAVIAWPLNAYRSGAKLPGALILFDTSGQSLAPALADLGDRVRLYYITEADLGLG